MTAVEETALPPQARTRTAREGGHRLRAPFSLRCGALLIDYIVLVAIVVFGTLIARMLGGGARSAGSSAETIGLVVAVEEERVGAFALRAREHELAPVDVVEVHERALTLVVDDVRVSGRGFAARGRCG